MMPRYVIGRRRPSPGGSWPGGRSSGRSKSEWEDDWIERVPVAEHIPTVSDHEAVDTGLVDKSGEPIMRMPYPVGFLWGDE